MSPSLPWGKEHGLCGLRATLGQGGTGQQNKNSSGGSPRARTCLASEGRVQAMAETPAQGRRQEHKQGLPKTRAGAQQGCGQQ